MLRFLLPVTGCGGNVALFTDYILQLWGQKNRFICNSWVTVRVIKIHLYTTVGGQ